MSAEPVQILASAAMAPRCRRDLPESLVVTPIEGPASLGSTPGEAVVLALDPLWDASAEQLRALPRWVVVVAPPGPAADQAEAQDRLFLTLPQEPEAVGERRERWRAAVRHAQSLASAERLARARDLAARDLFELSEIGGALMQPRDTDDLMWTILHEARRVTASDAGSLYLVEGEELRFRWTQNDSLQDLTQPNLTIPIDHTSFAGHAAASGETIRVDDAYAADEGLPCAFDRRFDEASGYRTRAVLVVPMLTPEGETVGVLQLLNPAAGRFTHRDQQMARALGGQAAVSIANQRLRDDIEGLFDGFVLASVKAIDQRDPATSGHSLRVATLTCALAEHADAAGGGSLRDVRFSRAEMREIRYAALLHDFGKVFVREDVLRKDRKLPLAREARLQGRFERAHEILVARFHEARARHLAECGPAGFELVEKTLREQLDRERERLRAFERAVWSANEPRVLAADAPAELAQIAALRMSGADQHSFALLDEEDLRFLTVPRGSLTEEERLDIESHVTYTQRFLEQIPWTRDLSRVDAIAAGHHEKLDGSGYPAGLAGDAIPVQTRILTIADIFDALRAADRPYKKALPLERVLDILHADAAAGQVDRTLLDLFCETRAWNALDATRP